MGVVAKAVTGVIDDVLGTDTQGDLEKLTSTDPLLKWGEEEVLSTTDEAIFGTSLEELEKPIVLPEVEPEYESRETPAILRTESNVEELSEEELEEQAILGKSKKNLLRIPLTGGLETPTAGVGTPGDTGGTAVAPAGSGLQL